MTSDPLASAMRFAIFRASHEGGRTKRPPCERNRGVSHPRFGGVAEWLKAHAWKVCIRETVSRVRIPLPPPFQSQTGHCVYAITRYQRLKQPGFRSHDTHFTLGNLDALGKRAEMVAAIAPAFYADTLTCSFGEFAQHLRRDGLAPGVLEHRLAAFGVRLGLIADGFKAKDAVLQRRVVQIGDACLFGVIKPPEAGFRLGCTPVQLGDMSRWRSDRSCRRSSTVARIVSSRSGWSRRSSR